jgi:26S proteasome regulatory subunit N12
LNQLFHRFQQNVWTGNVESASTDLDQLKRIMVDLDSLPPLCQQTPAADQEREIFRHVLEYAVLLSVQLEDRSSFQRNVASLRPYYTQFGYGNLGSDSVTPIVLALNLLYFLVENRLADFHCELELLPEHLRQLPTVTFCTELEQHLVVGAYDLVLESAANPPASQFSFFLSSLLETVRINIGDCVSSAYSSLKVSSATKILMFQRDNETLDFIASNYPDWRVSTDGVIYLNETKTVKSDEIPSMKLIAQTLSYATEMERIV